MTFDPVKRFLQSLNWRVLVGAIVLCVILAVVNNIVAGDDKSVAWFGTQETIRLEDE